jgi:ECF transporter S component (folate family)
MEKSMFTTRMMTRLSALIALSVVFKVYLSFTDGPNWRFSLFGIPLVIVGLLFKPHIAIITGLIVDFIYVLLSPFAWSVNLMTMEAISFALIPSLIVLLIGREKITSKHIVFSVILANMIGFIFNTTQLAIWANGFGPILPFIPIRLVFMITNMFIGSSLMVILYQRLNSSELIEEM